MAIVNITRLQVRRGDRADLPQLASAELGWAIDTQQLFIGNGALAEGSPYVGNTEILTEHSDVLQNFGSFKYQNNGVGSVIANSVSRTIQSKLDDTASVLDWGATSNGGDSSAAINLALSDLYSTDGDQQTQVKLYIPAGVYILNSPLLVPPNAYLYGDGMGNTILKRNGTGPVMITADSALEYGISMGTNINLSVNQTIPNNIVIADLTLQHTSNQDLTQFQSTTDMILERVEFVGVNSSSNFPLSSIPYNAQTGLAFTSPSDVVQSGRITVNQCRFKELGIGVHQTQIMKGMSLNQCTFDFLYNGVVVDDGYVATASISATTMIVTSVTSGTLYPGCTVTGLNVAPGTVIVDNIGGSTYTVSVSQTVNSTTISGSSGGISRLTIQNSSFSRINRAAIVSNNTASFSSINNRFVNVGNRGSGVPIDPEIIANGPGCTSWMDISDRPESSGVVRFSAGSVGVQSRVSLDPLDRFSFGLTEQLVTHKYTLAGNSTGTLDELSFYIGDNIYSDGVKNVNTPYQTINYVVKRDNATQSGTMLITADGTPEISFVNNYNTSGTGDPGVSFIAAISVNGLVTITWYTTAGSAATLLASATNFVDE